MKRIFALALALLLFSTVPSFAENAELIEEKPTPTSLVVGNPTPMRGQFFTDMWGNATSDIDVRDLLHAYNLIYWDGENGMFTVDPSVVSGVALTENEEGDHTYVLALYDDLYFSDGSKITAWDYAFSYLFSISPLLNELGASPLRREEILGYESYLENGGVLSGIRVLSDEIISVTLDHRFLPFFYEMGLLSCLPYPISVIAPGVTVRDDGNGVYLANQDETVTEPVFTPDLLRKTILNETTGYLSHPSVVSGPYTLTAWDGETAEFEINPFFKGNSRGQTPKISRLTYTLARNDTMIEQLIQGEFGLLNKVTRSDQIAAGIKRAEDDTLNFSNYPRIGLSYISFATERDTVKSENVRRAIAYCLDRDAVTEAYTGAFGLRVDSYYGIGQWMYGVATGAIAPPVHPPEDENDAEARAAYEEERTAFEEISLENLFTVYAVNTQRARELLEEDGWLLNREGVREKNGVTLDLQMIYPEGNSVNESLQKHLIPYLNEVGIRLTLEAKPMDELLSMWYQQEERSADMIYLASNFDLIFDPSVHFALDGSWAYTNLKDEPLYNAAVAMRKTEPGDVLTYMRHWLEFEKRFNEILPMIPIYSNLYFDFYQREVRDYWISENVTWGQAIVGAWIGEAPEKENGL